MQNIADDGDEGNFSLSTLDKLGAGDAKSAIHPDKFINKDGAVDRDAVLNEMFSEEEKIRDLMVRRREEAQHHEKELSQVVEALRRQGYDQDQINDIFNSGMMTRELIEELIATL